MLNLNNLEGIAAQRRQEAEHAAAADRLVLEAERAQVRPRARRGRAHMRGAWLIKILGRLGVIATELGRLPAHSADADRLYREMRSAASGGPPSLALVRAVQSDGAPRPSGDPVQSRGALSLG